MTANDYDKFQKDLGNTLTACGVAAYAELYHEAQQSGLSGRLQSSAGVMENALSSLTHMEVK